MPGTTGSRAPAPANRDTPVTDMAVGTGTPCAAPAREPFHCPECGEQVSGQRGKLLKCGFCRCRFRVLKRMEAQL